MPGRLLVTGSSGLIGSEVVSYFAAQNWTVFGIDNNERARFFGADGDTRWNQARLAATHPTFEHIELDIRDRDGILACIARVRPDLLVHAAAQPSHDLAASRPFEHSGVELHGFLSYLVRANLEERTYKVFGYKGKQVRDNIHALDVARFIACFFEKPRSAEVYNMGGGRANSCSILEAFAAVERLTGKPMRSEYVDTNREGDHICYIS